MKVRFMPEVEDALFEIGVWVEQRNTQESGSRFINKFIDKISSYALPNVKYPLCRNKVLQALGLCCIAIDDWVIAFVQTKDEFVVHFILYGPGLR